MIQTDKELRNISRAECLSYSKLNKAALVSEILEQEWVVKKKKNYAVIQFYQRLI